MTLTTENFRKYFLTHSQGNPSQVANALAALQFGRNESEAYQAVLLQVGFTTRGAVVWGDDYLAEQPMPTKEGLKVLEYLRTEAGKQSWLSLAAALPAEVTREDLLDLLSRFSET